MPSQIYEILSLMMRYWFAALGVLIVLRAFWWLWKDHRSREKKRRSLPDAGSIGEFVVESDCAALPQDTLLPVPADGTLGSVRSCDIVVPARGVSPRHLDVMFRNGYGLYIIPWRGCSCIVDGETVANRRDGMAHPLPVALPENGEREMVMATRPNQIEMNHTDGYKTKVEKRIFLTNYTEYLVRVGDQLLQVQTPHRNAFAQGETCYLKFPGIMWYGREDEQAEAERNRRQLV